MRMLALMFQFLQQFYRYGMYRIIAYSSVLLFIAFLLFLICFSYFYDEITDDEYIDKHFAELRAERGQIYGQENKEIEARLRQKD